MARLNGSTALVTGGASGLGKAIGLRLAADGARVVITDIQGDLGLAGAAEHGLEFFEQDVCDEAAWRRIARVVQDRFGQLDVLVNNAGIAGPADAVTPEDTRLNDWNRLFAVNVTGVFLGCKTAISMMRRSGGGSIINISSAAALSASPGATAYGATKAAVRQLTKSVAQYCAEERLNIRCNSVHPGVTRTPLWDQFAIKTAEYQRVSFDECLAAAESRVPLGDLTRPEDVASAVAFLASDEARHITGEKIVVDGGRTSCATYRGAK